MRGRSRGERSLVALVLLGTLLLVAPGTAAARPASPVQQKGKVSATATATVSDTTLEWDQHATVSGSGWYPGTQVQVVLYTGARVLGSTTVPSDGTISIGITAPHVTSSSKYVLVVQGIGKDGGTGFVQIPITITGPTPTISISSASLHWRDTPTVSGELYQPGTTVQLTLVPDTISLGSATVDGSGAFHAPVTIPSDLRSSKGFGIEVTGEGIDGLFHLEALQITITGDRPTIALSSGTAPRGTSLTVTGQLFLKKTDVLITLLPGYEKLGSFPVADDGTFSARVTIPTKAGGTDPHAILVTGTGEDTLFAYLTSFVNIHGKPPKGTTTANAIGIDQNSPTPPGFQPLAQTPVTLGGSGSKANDPVSVPWLVVALVVLLCVATIIVFALTARRDVRRNLRRRKDRLLHRFRAG